MSKEIKDFLLDERFKKNIVVGDYANMRKVMKYIGEIFSPESGFEVVLTNVEGCRGRRADRIFYNEKNLGDFEHCDIIINNILKPMLATDYSGNLVKVTRDGFEFLNKIYFPKKVDRFGFEKALEYLKQGKRVKREKWVGAYLALESMEDSFFTQPLVCFRTEIGNFIPYTSNNDDLLATDWILI